MAQVGEVRNSPLWVADPRQQLAYLATKRWARLHAPDVMLGVYSVDELQDHAIERPMGPAEVVHMPGASRTEAVKAKLASRQPARDPVPSPELGPDLGTVLRMIEDAYSREELKAAVDSAKLLPKADQVTARDIYKARVAEIKAQQEAEAQNKQSVEQSCSEWQSELGGEGNE